ncbi:hypothetical protein JL720_14057 [Aureococcus anophagefferens]|nr:hypothetical protein JL720_14057 [Aureococcus anophagefferens]
MDLLAAQRRPSTPSAGELHSQFARLHLPFVGRPYRAVPLPRPSRGALEAHWRRAAEALSLPREDLADVYRRSFGEPCGGLSMAQLMQRVLPVLSGIAAARRTPRGRGRDGARDAARDEASSSPRGGRRGRRRGAPRPTTRPRAARRRRGCPPSTARRPVATTRIAPPFDDDASFCPSLPPPREAVKAAVPGRRSTTPVAHCLDVRRKPVGSPAKRGAAAAAAPVAGRSERRRQLDAARELGLDVDGDAFRRSGREATPGISPLASARDDVDAAIANYEITIDSESGCFWPGDAVTGRLVLETTKPIKCRGIRIRLEGVGVGHWHTGGGDDRKDYHAEKKYLLDECGENAVYDPATGGGDMPTACDGTETLAVRVMDYDWGKRDDMLGECVVRLGELMSQTILAGGQPVSMPLYRKGKSGDLGEVTLSAARRHGARRCPLLAGDGSAEGDWVGKNDVYVQAYVVFAFTIPAIDDLPPSFEGPVERADKAYVRYSVYSNIDIKMRQDPSTRRPITLLARARLPPPNAYAPVVRGPTEAQIIYKCECCVPCGLGCEQGTAQFQACVSQAAVSVGDVVYVAALATNSTEHEATFHVDLVTKIRIERRNGKVSLSYLPTALVLALPQYAPLAAVVVAGGVDETAAPPPLGGVYAGPCPTANVVSVLGPAPITNRQEDEHNYNNGEKGPPPPFQPIYMGAVEPTPCAFALPAHAGARAAKPPRVAAASDPLMAPAALEMADRDTAAGQPLQCVIVAGSKMGLCDGTYWRDEKGRNLTGAAKRTGDDGTQYANTKAGPRGGRWCILREGGRWHLKGGAGVTRYHFDSTDDAPPIGQWLVTTDVGHPAPTVSHAGTTAS